MAEKEFEKAEDFVEVEASLTPLTRGDKGGVTRNHLPYNPKLTSCARENRRTGCLPEVRMWKYILSRRQTGYKFLRQKPIDHYIVDFYCSKLRMAIEIDGDSHSDRISYDSTRTERLQILGVVVVRYINSDVLCRLQGVYDDLMSRIRQREDELGITPLNPPLSGG